ncbi:MAG: hypothetical protein ACRCYV_04120 [Aeromonas sp.]
MWIIALVLLLVAVLAVQQWSKLSRSEQYLADILKENAEKLNLSADGVVSLNMRHPATKEALQQQIRKLERIEIEPRPAVVV